MNYVEKRAHDIGRITSILRFMNRKGQEKCIYFQPLLWETVRVLGVTEPTAKEYIKIALEVVGLSREDIQWYDKRFIKPTLNENQRILKLDR